MTTYTDTQAARNEIENLLEGWGEFDLDTIAEQAIITSAESTPVAPRYELADNLWDIIAANAK